MRLRLTLLVTALLLAAAAQDQPLPEEQELHHQVKLQNRFIRVQRFELPAAASTPFFSRSHETIGVVTGPSPLRTRLLGRVAVEQHSAPAGDLFGGDFTREPQVQRIWNVGERPYRALLVELVNAPVTILEPDGPKDPDFETPHLSAFRYVLPAGVSSPIHTHTRPYLLVAATSVQLKFVAPDGKSTSDELASGDFRWFSGNVTHALVNAGAGQAQIVEIEIRHGAD
jgi:quercetin dioxygenase-like cupin family protein